MADRVDGRVDPLDQGFVELPGVADDRACVEEDRVAVTARVWVSGQREERVAPGAGQDRGGQQGEPAVREGDGGTEASREALAFPEQAVPAARDRLPRTGGGPVGP